MHLSTLRNELAKVERGIEVSDKANYTDLLDLLQGQRSAMTMLASHLIPRSKADADLLHGLIDELSDFVDDEPASEVECAQAIEAIRRINQNLRVYMADG